MNDVSIFGGCVLIWGTTWLAITYQLGSVAPEVSVSHRFFLAALIIAAWCRFRGLSLLGTVVAFAGWLTLVGRIGAPRASYVGVMAPVVALFVSTWFEGFVWHPLTAAARTAAPNFSRSGTRPPAGGAPPPPVSARPPASIHRARYSPSFRVR